MNATLSDSERINKILTYVGVSANKFAKLLGCNSPDVIYYIQRGRNGISGDMAGMIVKYKPEISLDWLLTGEGSMLKGDEMAKAIPVPEGSREGIPLIPASAFAGGFTGEVQTLEYECERYIVPMFRDADFLIPVKGSSMYPKYSSGDVVACRRLKSWSFFQWGKVYVLYTEQGPIIKRILEGMDEEHVLVVSENAERYKAFQLHKSEIMDVAIVVGVLRME